MIFWRKPSEKKEQSLLRLLLPSLLGFALCFVCLAATTWAWFTAYVTSEANTIQTANFDVNVAVTATSGTVTDKGNNVYSLSAGTYTVTLTPTGNATKGFAVVEVAAAQPPSSQMLMLASAGNEEQQATPPNMITAAGTYYTQQLFVDGAAQIGTFTIQTTGDVTLTVKAYWGEKQTDLDATPITATLMPLSDEAQLASEDEDPVDETEPEEEKKEEEKKEENLSDDQESTDDPETSGEEENDPETSTDTPTGGEQGGGQQTDKPSDTTDGEGGQQGGDPIVEGEPSSSNVGDNTGGEPSTGGETGESNVPADTADTADTTTPTVQSEVAPAEPAPIE